MENGYTIEVGDRWFTHPDCPSILFGSLNGVKEHFTRSGLPEVDAEGKLDQVKAHDTRMLLCKIAKELHRHEGHIWDEYLDYSGASRREHPKAKWPSGWNYRWVKVYVVTGANEGYYLHVDMEDRDEKQIRLFLGKSLSGASWEELWASAGRIAKALGA